MKLTVEGGHCMRTDTVSPPSDVENCLKCSHTSSTATCVVDEEVLAPSLLAVEWAPELLAGPIPLAVPHTPVGDVELQARRCCCWASV